MACRMFSWMVRSFSRQSTLFSRRRRVSGRFTFSRGLQHSKGRGFYFIGVFDKKRHAALLPPPRQQWVHLLAWPAAQRQPKMLNRDFSIFLLLGDCMSKLEILLFCRCRRTDSCLMRS
eukprot:1161864-Pelagomonas_calceolata.AAC.16